MLIVDILSSIKSNIEKINELIEDDVIDGLEYCLYMFTEQKEVIEDLIEDLNEGIAVAKNKELSARKK